MIEQGEFIEKYRIDEEKFSATKISWDELIEIHENYKQSMSNLQTTALYISERLRSIPAVHSLRIRLKDPEHLIEKIIRKKAANSSFDVNINNYRDMVTDLIGLRALHLFKEDWESIHDFIMENWELYETPTANVRKGDSEKFLKKFKNKECVINEHKFGYRSVHYIVKSTPGRQLHLAEIQVRTIFEEGFSEIDHQVRYPYDQDNLIIASYLAIFNRLAGSADEMGSFVKILKFELAQKDKMANKLAEEREVLTSRLKEQVKKLKIAKEEKERIQNDLDSLLSKSRINLDQILPENIILKDLTSNYLIDENQLHNSISKISVNIPTSDFLHNYGIGLGDKNEDE
jgi:ppGpp synthetase/RelA/SpoT-type nucleotidyltranferase